MTRANNLMLKTAAVISEIKYLRTAVFIVKNLCEAYGCIEISSHVIRHENNQFHLFRRGPASEGKTVDGLLNELNGRRIVMDEEQFENWMNEEI